MRLTPQDFGRLVERQAEQDTPYDKPLAYLVKTGHDGSIEREGPMSYWAADMLIGSGAFVGGQYREVVIERITDFDRYVGDA